MARDERCATHCTAALGLPERAPRRTGRQVHGEHARHRRLQQHAEAGPGQPSVSQSRTGFGFPRASQSMLHARQARLWDLDAHHEPPGKGPSMPNREAGSEAGSSEACCSQSPPEGLACHPSRVLPCLEKHFAPMPSAKRWHSPCTLTLHYCWHCAMNNSSNLDSLHPAPVTTWKTQQASAGLTSAGMAT